MNKFFIVSACLALLLSACGTGSQSNGSSQPAKNTSTTEQSEPAANEVEDGSSEEEATEQSSSTEGTETTQESVEQTEEQASSKEVEEDVTTVTSENQGYSIQLLDGYELMEEEPRKDVIALTEDEHTFMRIEMIPEDMTIEEAEENMKQLAMAIDVNTKPREEFSREGMLQDAIWYESYTEEDAIHSILVKGTTPMQLTIYTAKDQNHVEPFLEMASTIKK